MPKISKNTITFDSSDFLACLHPQYVAGITDTPAAQADGFKLASSSAMNPYRFMGYAAPGYNPSDLTNSSTAIAARILNGVIGYESSVAYGYWIEEGAKLHQSTLTSTPAVTNTGVWPHTIAAVGNETGSDVSVYRVGTATRLFYSYNDSGGAWNVGMYNFDGATFDDDFMSTVPAGSLTFSGNTSPHPMIVGADDVLYMGDGNKVHAYDGQEGAAGTKFDSVLVLPSGYRVTCFARLPTMLCVFAYFEPLTTTIPSTYNFSNAKCFMWNYLDEDPTYVYELTDNYVSEALEWKGTVVAFTSGRQTVFDGSNRFCRVQVYDGSKFEPVQEFIGNPPVHGGAETLGESFQWNSDGFVHQYGPSFEGQPVGLNKTATGSSSGASTNCGVCKTLAIAAGTVISTGSATGGLTQLRSNYAASAWLTTQIGDPLFDEETMGQIHKVKVEFAKTSSGGRALDVYLNANYMNTTNSLFQIISGVTAVTSSNIIKNYNENISGVDGPKFTDLRLILQWTGGSAATDAPVVKRVTVYFDPVNIEIT